MRLWGCVFVAVFWPRVFVMIVDAEQCPGEGEDFAEGYQHGVVYLARRRQNKPCHEQSAAEGDKGNGGEYLYSGLVFAEVHNLWRNYLCMW